MISYRFGPEDLGRVRFAISPLFEIAASLDVLRDPARHAMHASWLAQARERLRGLDLAQHDDEAANGLVMALGRLLIPVNYTRSGPFEHDLALGTTVLPGLADAGRLGQLDPASDEFRYLQTQLLRERNRVEHALRAALRLVGGAADATRG